MTARDVALDLAARGVRVFPCRSRAKTPATEHGYHDATDDPATIRKWWAQHQDANTGVACDASGIVVIDVDPRNGGESAFAQLEHDLGPLPRTVAVQTGGGGRHYYLRAPEGAEFRGGLGAGVDLKHRGYVLAPGSTHPNGQSYTWLLSPDDCAPAPIPAAWLARMVKPVAPATMGRPDLPATRASGNYGRAAIDREFERVRTAPEGERNKTLNTAAHSLGQLCAGGTIDDVREALVAAAIAAGLREGEARKTVESGWRAGSKKPRAPRLRSVAGGGPPPVAVEDGVATAGRDGQRPARAYAMTETGGAELLADRLARDWRYCEDRKSWVRWTGQVWVFDAGDVAITERSKLIAHEFLAEAQWALKADDARAKDFARFAATAQRRQFRRAVIDLAKSEPGILIPFTEFDGDAYLLNAANGTVDLRAGKLRAHSREDKITHILPWSYDSAATCPRWERFLAEILPDAETVAFVRRAIGYTLTADVREHVLFSCFGAGANGKSVLLNTLLHVFGPYATTAPTSMLVAKQHESHPAEKMVLVGKRLAVFQEIPSGQRLNEALVKALVSGDPDQARAMRENFIPIRPVAKLWLAGNHHLDIREQTEAIWRRYREIPFERVFAEDQRDPNLEAKLRDEAPGILAWCVRACLEWQHGGLGKSGKVQAATADLRSEMDRIGPFIDECCTVAPSATVLRAALYQAYRTWAERQGSHAVSDKGFAELLRGRGFAVAYGRVNGKTARVWQGLGLTDGTPPLPHLPHIPEESPYCPQNQSPREGYREETAECVASVAPDPLSTLAHCLRARAGTVVTDADKAALVEHFAGKNGKAEAVVQRLWAYWRAAPAPTVTEFLAREPKGHDHV